MGRKKRGKVAFDKESVTKEVAKDIVTQHEINNQEIGEENHFIAEDENIKNGDVLIGNDGKSRKKKKRNKSQEKIEEEAPKIKKQKQNVSSTDETQSDASLENANGKSKKKKKQKQAPEKTTELKTQNQDDSATEEEADTSAENETSEDINPENPPQVKGEESIRAKKRKKHAALLQEKKLKAELALQQKCLNYLSQWKHNRDQWKFEKLKQVWLQQSMFNSDKIPTEMWDTLVEYFCGCKGKAREAIIKDALKVIDAEGEEGKEEEDAVDHVKVKRARDIIQNLQD